MSNHALQHMARGGKTFFFASRWLTPRARLDAATAYSFCRTVDDLADNLPTGAERTAALTNILSGLASHEKREPTAAAMHPLIERFPEIQAPAELLVRSCLSDTEGARIATVSDLTRYCHGVAGTVGLIMYPILGGREPAGRQLAADLGIAMQCTNIARDIVPDLRANRVYIPQEWLSRAQLEKLLDSACDTTTETIVTNATRRLLSLADEYYARGLTGLQYLDPRSRFAIRVAAECYRAIGSRVIQDGKLARTRAVVPLHQKIVLAVKAIRNAQSSTPLNSYQGAL